MKSGVRLQSQYGLIVQVGIVLSFGDRKGHGQIEPGYAHLPQGGADTSQGHYAVSVQVGEKLPDYRRAVWRECLTTIKEKSRSCQQKTLGFPLVLIPSSP